MSFIGLSVCKTVPETLISAQCLINSIINNINTRDYLTCIQVCSVSDFFPILDFIYVFCDALWG